MNNLKKHVREFRETGIFTFRRLSESATLALKAVIEDQTPDQHERSDKYFKAYYALASEDCHRGAADPPKVAKYKSTLGA